MDRILRAADIYRTDGADACANRFRELGTDVPPPVGGPPTGTALIARIDHGRWLIECECGSAQIADPSDPRFYCIRCYNVESNGRYRPVTYPNDPDAFEAVLLARPNQANRNWLGETLSELVTENEAHGLPPARR